MQKIFLVTGGAGFIGTNLCEALIAAGHHVRVVDDLTAGNADRLPAEVVFHKVDIRHTTALTDICEGVDVLVHLAALPRVQFSIDEPVAAHDVNVNGTLSVLEAARVAGVGRVVFATSAAVYGDQETLPLSLSLPAEPKSPYALHKLMGEDMMKLWSMIYALPTVSLRFFNVYGPHFDPDGPYALVIGRFLKLRKEGAPLTVTGDGEQTRDFVHVHDVVSAIIRAATATQVGNGEVLNVGSGVPTSINELVAIIGGDVEYVPPRLEPRHSLADISETKRLLSWEPTKKVADGVAALLAE